MPDFSLDLTDIPAALRPAADLLADRRREIVEGLNTGRADNAWAQPRLRSIALAMEIMRQPAAALLAHDAAGDWPDVRRPKCA